MKNLDLWRIRQSRLFVNLSTTSLFSPFSDKNSLNVEFFLTIYTMAHKLYLPLNVTSIYIYTAMPSFCSQRLLPKADSNCTCYLSASHFHSEKL